jgi:glycosyltransferase involved in cell wall biosynthesis
LGPLRAEDVIHFPFSLLGRGLPCATVVTIHDLMWLEQPELVEGRPLLRRVREKYYQRGMLWALRRATRLIAVSEATRARMVAAVPECAERVRVTHNAADARFRPAANLDQATREAAAVVGSGAPYYLVVGKNEPYKAHELALAAFAQAARADELLVLIQRTSNGRGLSELAERLGIARRLRFLPAVSPEQLLALLQCARALIQPSLVEGFGIPVLEAMASGCPVVTSDCPALLEVTSGAGLHAPVGSVAGLADALERLRAPGLAAELRQRGLARAEAFDWERTASRTLTIYEEAATEHAARARAQTA